MMFSYSMFSHLMDWFHNFNCSLLLGILLFVMYIIFFLFKNNFLIMSMKFEFQFAELLCSLIPVFILLFQMYPSMSLLYFYGTSGVDSDLSIKVMGHQWYWNYEISDLMLSSFDSYMKPLDDLFMGNFRLLEVDNRCILPVNMNICFCLSSEDVIHSWTIFNYFIKLDVMSGILSIFYFYFPVIGVFYGQCSEICGANHGFMPVVLEITLFDMFKYWCLTFWFSIILFFYI